MPFTVIGTAIVTDVGITSFNPKSHFMRKSLLLSVLLFISTLAFAQIEKGKYQLSGSLNFSQQNNTANQASNLSVGVQAGYFVSEKTSVGLLAGVSRRTFDGRVFAENNQLEYGVYARFHKSLADNFYIFAEPSWRILSSDNDTGTNSIESNVNQLSIAPGIAYFLSPKIAMEMRAGSLFISSGSIKSNGNEETSNSYGISLNGNNVLLGFTFLL